MSRKLSPFGVATCCICDESTTHAVMDEDETWLLYCTPCTEMIVREFPELAVVQWRGTRAACGDGEVLYLHETPAASG